MRFSRSFGIAASFSAATHWFRDLAYDHVGDHVVRLGLGERRARARIEAADQVAHAAHAGVVGVQQALQLA